ncbi:MAG: diguanylate cyclase [Chloroflexi bacterium]|nr:diguanylate cyclase [Anaerolineaceae bacterium]NMB87898.1 diguanylate cyclase [Chloroflexota bacterium]
MTERDDTIRILLIDDDEDDFMLLRELVKNRPSGNTSSVRFVLQWISDFDDALQAFSRQEHDIYLVDYHLGSHNGLDLLRDAHQQGVKAPMILLTGQGNYSLDLAAMNAGAADYIPKDLLNAPLLERSIRYAIEQKQAQNELEARIEERTHALAHANEELRDEIERRKASEDAVRASEERFRALSETTSAAIFIIQNHKIRYANPAARQITGYSQEELLQRELWEIAHPAYQHILRQNGGVASWSEKMPTRYEIKIVSKEGHERWLDMTAGLLENKGKQPSWVITAFDITARDLAEKELQNAKADLEQRVAERTLEIQQTNQRLQTILDTLPVAVWIADPQGKVITVNEMVNNLWGPGFVPPATIQDFQKMKGWHTESNHPLRPEEWPLVRAATQGETVISETIDILRTDGKRVTLLNSAAPIHDPDGGLAGGVTVVQDITPQRQLEQQSKEAASIAQSRAEELRALQVATVVLLNTIDLDTLVGQILNAAQRAIPAAEKGWLHLVARDTGKLQVRATLGYTDPRIRRLSQHRNVDYISQVVRERKPLLIYDSLHTSPSEDFSNGEPMRSLIICPLVTEDEVIGTLALSATQPSAFSEADLRLLSSFAATTTAAINNATLHAEVQRLATSDPLTGIKNRRAFFDLGQHQVERCLRQGLSLSAMMIDIDHFKDINDTHGHPIGDQVLRSVAALFQGMIRKDDILGRYGGDEFAILLPGTNLFEASEITSRIQRAFKEKPIATDAGPVTVAVSIGISTIKGEHIDLNLLLNRADTALYHAKRRGRDRTEVA